MTSIPISSVHFSSSVNLPPVEAWEVAPLLLVVIQVRHAKRSADSLLVEPHPTRTELATPPLLAILAANGSMLLDPCLARRFHLLFQVAESLQANQRLPNVGFRGISRQDSLELAFGNSSEVSWTVRSLPAVGAVGPDAEVAITLRGS